MMIYFHCLSWLPSTNILFQRSPFLFYPSKLSGLGGFSVCEQLFVLKCCIKLIAYFLDNYNIIFLPLVQEKHVLLFVTLYFLSIANSEPVAFQAHLSVDHALYPTSATIKFDDVVLNSGSGYNPATGKFTCPNDGFYSFTWTITTRARKVCHTIFMIDSQPVMRGYLDIKKNQPILLQQQKVLSLK